MKYMYNSKNLGKNIFLHNWFIELIPNLKKGWTMGIPVKNGIAIFKFMGIKELKTSIEFKSIEKNGE